MIQSGELRIAKQNANNPFGEGPLKTWFHVPCFLEVKANKTKITFSSSNDIDGFKDLNEDDQKYVFDLFGKEFKTKSDICDASTSKQNVQSASTSKDDLFSEFNKLIDKVAEEPSYNLKTTLIQKFLRDGSNRKKFSGNLEVWLKLLIPKVDQRVYNIQDKQIVKLFSRIFSLKHDDLLQDLHAGDVSETIASFFKKSKAVKPVNESLLTLTDIDDFLEKLVPKTREEEQVQHFEALCKKCTTEDIRTVIRLIKKDLKMNCREKHVLAALHDDAYDSFQKSRNLSFIIKQYGSSIGKSNPAASTSSSKISRLQVMTPIAPQLAEACKDFDKALKKCPKGFYSEIKYDGERVQVHKKGNEFKYFSRNLKPVQEHKISKLKEYLPKAFPNANDIILDSEIIMVDTNTGSLLPFGTLGKHKKNELDNASTCLFVFDVLFFNGEDLTKKSMKERKEFLEKTMQPQKHHVEMSEYKYLTKKNELIEMTKDVLKQGLEGLVLKDVSGEYEPGKRRWLKVKKDYLLEGAIADSCDLVILGGYFGTGKMGNQYSVFLMGCYDEENKLWKTVTKVHSGLDDMTMDRIHKKIAPLMEPWNANKKLPSWVLIDRTLTPDAIAKDPFNMPVFEISAAEFTNSDTHTADSISMRFPRITRIRKDKTAKEATTLNELKHLFEESKSGVNIDELNKLKNDSQPMSVDDDTKKSVATKSTSSLSLTAGALKRKTNDIDDNKVNNEEIDDDDDDDELAPTKNKKVRDTEKSDVKDEKVEIADVKNNMFEGYILYEKPYLTPMEIVKFERYGGKLTSVSMEANLVLYDGKEVKSDLDNLRKLYLPTCKHYQKSWFTQSLESKEIANPLKHFVVLHQT